MICIQGDVTSLDRLRDDDGKFLAGVVNVTGSVHLPNMDLERLPVRFGAVGKFFNCSRNQLTTLEGAPSTVNGNFDCSSNRLTSLEGAPGSIGENLYCHENRLTTLVGVHRSLRRVGDGTLYIRGNWGNGNEIVSGGIGLLLVEGLTRIVANQPAFKIINGFLGQGKRGLLRCQEALHDAGHGEHARL